MKRVITTEIKKEEWDAFIRSQKYSQFLQSWDWGEFQASQGNHVIRLALVDDRQIKAVAAFFQKKLPIGLSYFYGPRINFSGELIREAYQLAKQKKCAFIRIEPMEKTDLYSLDIKAVPSAAVQPSQTLILDLGYEEEDILAKMHPKTRYNIRLAIKKGVVVRKGTASDFPSFWRIMEETKNRDGFRLHEPQYYEKMLSIPWIELLFAEKDGRILAGSISSFFPGDTAVYIHGASANQERNLMSPYALQWYGIKHAKAEGFKYYDFHGIDEKKWPGVTRFKLGFGGERVVYPGAFDLVVDERRYLAYKIFRKIRRLF